MNLGNFEALDRNWAQARDAGVLGSNEHQPMVMHIEAAIGVGPTARLLSSFGGRRIYVPSAPRAGERLVGAIGMASARKLGAIFGGERIWLPKAEQNTIKSTRIRRMRRRGMSVSQIARIVGCSDRHVWKVLAAAREE
jgi:Mor family transcriptional regulator